MAIIKTMNISSLFLVNVFLVFCLFSCAVSGKCPCKDEALCQPISKQYVREVFVFSVDKDHWPKYDWSRMTSIVQVGYHNSEMLCYAHSKGVRIIAIANFQPTSALTNKTARSVWVKDTVKTVQDNYLDGVNVDFESYIYPNETEWKEGLTALMQELSVALKTANKNYQLTIDYAWSPACIDGRCYDFLTISKVVDFVFVMAYDERSQIFYDCIAWGNSAFNQTESGVETYMKLGVPANKIVLGVPWYGYDYPCVKYLNGTCYLKNVPFRGVKCSDAAGSQVGYSDIMNKLLPTATTGLLWDNVAKSPYFTYKNNTTKQFHQVWFDNPKSLKLKYRYADMKGLKGIGMWEADDLDYSDTEQAKKQRAEMWSILATKLNNNLQNTIW